MRRTRTASPLVATLLLLAAGCSSDRPAADSDDVPTGLPTSAPRLAVDGSYSLVLTVVESGVEAEPVGATTQPTWTVDADCPTFPCTGTITSENGTVYDVRLDGTTLAGSATSTEVTACPDQKGEPVPGAEVTQTSARELVLSFQPGPDGAVAMDGRLTTSLSLDPGTGPCTAPPPATVVSDVSGTRQT